MSTRMTAPVVQASSSSTPLTIDTTTHYYPSSPIYSPTTPNDSPNAVKAFDVSSPSTSPASSHLSTPNSAQEEMEEEEVDYEEVPPTPIEEQEKYGLYDPELPIGSSSSSRTLSPISDNDDNYDDDDYNDNDNHIGIYIYYFL